MESKFTEKGFIKLHRTILDWYGQNDPLRFSLWIHLLLLANHSTKKWIFKGKPYNAERGQFITSRVSLSALTGISQSQIERLLNEFEKEKQIEQQKTTRNRLISILNYNDYQETGQQQAQQQTQQKDNGRTTEGQHKDTNKNEKNEKNEKNIYFVDFCKSTHQKWNDFCDQFPILSKINSISATRRNHLKVRFTEKQFDFDAILSALIEQPKAINGIPFKDGSSWQVTFDFIIKNDTNYLKILERKYQDAEQKRTSNADEILRKAGCL